MVHLHIGTMKTGTSFLQQVLRRNVELLSERGVLYPLEAGSIGGAARDVLESGDEVPSPDGAWAKLSEHLHAWPGRSAVVSSEFLSFATPEQVAEFVKPLRPLPVEIVVTARDLARIIPSAWQNKVKHGKGWAFANYVEAVTRQPPRARGPARSFWHHHDLVDIVRRWSDVVGIDHVTVVTVPPSGAPSDVLWQRFAEACEVDSTDFDLTQDQRSNLSLGFTEAELMRLVNRELRGRVDRDDYRRHIQSYFANVVLRPDVERAAARDRPLLPPAAHEWAIEQGHHTADALRAAEVTVVGDLSDLVPSPLTHQQREAADSATPPVIPDPVVRAVAELLLRLVSADGGRRGRRGDAGRGRSASRPLREDGHEDVEP